MRQDKSFTLVEVMIVVVIIGILAALAIPQYQKIVNKARWSKVLNVTGALAESAYRYYYENGAWPVDGNLLDGTNPLDITPPNILGVTWGVGSGNACGWGYQHWALGSRVTSAGPGYAGTVWNDDGSSRAGYCDAAGDNAAPDNW